MQVEHRQYQSQDTPQVPADRQPEPLQADVHKRARQGGEDRGEPGGEDGDRQQAPGAQFGRGLVPGDTLAHRPSYSSQVFLHKIKDAPHAPTYNGEMLEVKNVKGATPNSRPLVFRCSNSFQKSASNMS